MKANQKFMEADNAVSPVIGVILMVAITVVLAAVVFVLVSDLGGGSADAQPNISWTLSQAQGTATVSAADPGTNWDEFEFRVTSSHDAAVTDITVSKGSGTDLTALQDGETQRPSDWGQVQGGDELTFTCTGGGSSGPLTVVMRHIDSNSVARTFDFNDLANCGA